MAEFNDLYDKAERLAAVELATSRTEQLQQSRGRVSGINTPAGVESLEQRNAPQIDRRSIGERFASSDIVKDFIRGGYAGRSEPFQVNGPEAEYVYDGNGEIDKLALITTGSPAYLVPPQVVGDIKKPTDYALNMRQVLTAGTTTSDTIYFVRELAFTNAAAETGQAASFDPTALGSSGRKPQSSLTFEQASAAVKTIAHWVPITRQALADGPQLQSYIEGRLNVGLDRRVNSQIPNGDGVGDNLTGILATSGIQLADDAYFAGAPVTNVGTQLEDFERILRATSNVDIVGDSKATFIALNPRDLERLVTIANDDHEYLGSSPFGASAARTIWGFPIAVDRAIPQGQFIVGDGTAGAVWDRMQNTILIDTINDQFIRNILTLLAETRLALTIFRPIAFVQGYFVNA